MADYPEYLAIFRNGGDYQVQVKFKNMDGTVADSAMRAGDIVELIDPETKKFYTKMRFDDWLFDISKYEIDPVKCLLTIRVCKTGSSAESVGSPGNRQVTKPLI